MKYLLALDQGTTSSRAVLIDETASIVALAQREFNQYFPASGFVEHDANEIWSSQIAVVHEAMAKKSIKSTEIAAIGITNQRETTVLWEKKTGQPIAKAIVWQDRRTTELCEKLKSRGVEPLFNKKTGLLLDPYFSGTKIRWLLDHVQGARAKAERGELAFGTIDSWLIWKLTEGTTHVTDPTNASRTLLFNINTLEWDDELLEYLEIPKSILPEVRSSSEIYGKTGAHIFSNPVPIAGIAGDQQAALFGQACLEAGSAKVTYGTGCFLLMNTGEQPVISSNRLLTTVAYQLKGVTHYALEGSVFNAGSAIKWLRDNLGLIKQSSDIEALAGSVADTGGVYLVPAFTGLGAPHWDPYARGAIFGISRATTSAHIARAVLESIVFQVTDVLKAMENDAKIDILELRVDGGVVVSDLLMQFQADLIDTSVLRPKNRELTATGAAFLAGIAVGIWKSEEEIKGYWKLEREFKPQMGDGKRQYLLSRWQKAVEKVKGWEE